MWHLCLNERADIAGKGRRAMNNNTLCMKLIGTDFDSRGQSKIN